MSGALNAGIAFAAGIVSFVSPCILPLVPAYLSLMGGSAATDGAERAPNWIAIRNTLFFVVGFAVVFVGLGVLFSSTFGLLGGARIVNVVAGAVISILGLNFLFDFFGFMNLERRVHLKGRPAGTTGSLLFGMAFGAGWTPCIGPILSSILLLAGTSGSVVRGATLLLLYSAGLGVPFILTSLFLSRALAQLARLRRHMGAIKIASGLFLIGIGLLILLGKLREFNGFLFGLSAALSQWATGNVFLARLLFGGVFVALAALVALFYVRAAKGEAAADSTPGRSVAPRRVHPFRLGLLVLLAAVGVLTFAGTIDLPGAVAAWLNFQGI